MTIMYGSWDTKHDRQNFLSFWTIFCPRKYGHACDFLEKGQKKGKKMLIKEKKSKMFENLGKNVQNLEIFWKTTGDCM